jgi:large subunit ribosomal protein L19
VINFVQILDKIQKCKTLPIFKAGDTIRIHLLIKEGKKERLQAFEGVCIARKNDKYNATVTIRKISFGYGVERIFPLLSPRIQKIEVLCQGKVRRSKLYYLRKLKGKKAKIKTLKSYKS